MTGFRATDREILGVDGFDENGVIELAIVDRGDLNEAHDLGDVDENDGNTLVQVRLLRGPMGDANKHRVWCRISKICYGLPAEGDQVLVAVPAGFGYSPGVPVIIAVMGPDSQALPGLKPNEPILMGPARNFVRCDTKGNVTLFTTDDGTKAGKSVFFQVRPDGFVLLHPYAKMRLDKTGFHVLHSSGARIDLGAVGGLPAPLSALASYAKVSAATVHVEGSAVTLGTATGVQDALAHATPTLATLTALSAAISAVAGQLAALVTGVAAIPTAGTAAAADAAALTTVTAAVVAGSAATLAAAAPLLPSNSTTAD